MIIRRVKGKGREFRDVFTINKNKEEHPCPFNINRIYRSLLSIRLILLEIIDFSLISDLTKI